jgi:hypothetical protein
MLRYGDPAPFTSGYFLEVAGALLSEEDAALLPYCSLDVASMDIDGGASDAITAKSEFVASWIEMARAYRSALAAARAAKLKRQAPATLVVPFSGQASDVQRTVDAALAMDNPLEAELMVDGALFGAVEELAGYMNFSVNTVYGYLIKLYIVERRSLFWEEEGFTAYKGLYTHIFENPRDSVK